MVDKTTETFRELDKSLIYVDHQFDVIKEMEAMINFQDSKGLRTPREMRATYHRRRRSLHDEIGVQLQEVRDLIKKDSNQFTLSEKLWLSRTEKELEVMNEYPALVATRLPRGTGHDTGCVIL